MSRRRGHRWRQFGLAMVVAQLGLQLVWYGLLWPPTRFPPAFVLGTATLPLVLPLLVMRVRFERGLLWAGFTALGYFSHGVMEAWASPGLRALALAEAAFAAMLVAALAQAARVEKRAALAGH